MTTLVLVGTTKGLFTLRSDDDRTAFELTGPSFAGEEVYATCIDSRSGATRLFTGSVSNHWGPVLRRSDDLGGTWTEDEQAALRYPEGTDAALAADLAAGTGSGRRAGRHVRRCRARRAVPQRQRREQLLVGQGTVGSPAPTSVGTGRRRLVPAHRPRPSRRPEPSADRDLGRRGLSIRRRWDVVAGVQPWDRRRVRARRGVARSSASACTRWRGTPLTPSASTSSTMAGSTAAMMAAGRGRR